MIVEDLYVSSETFTIIQPILIVARFFGLFPICYKKKGIQYMLKWSIGYGLYSYALYIGLITATISGIYRDFQKDKSDSLRMTDLKTRVVTCCDISGVMLIIIFSGITLIFKIKKFWKVMQILNKAEKIFPMRNPKQYRKASTYFLLFVLSVTIIMISFDIYLWIGRIENSTKRPLDYMRDYLGFYFMYHIIIIKGAFFWHVIFFIKIRISMLNNYLYKMKKLDNGITFIECTVSKGEIKRCKRNEVSPEACTFKYNSTELANRIMAMMRFQEFILEVVESVNGSVEYGIHIIMLSCLLHLIVTPYFLLVEILNNGSPFFITLQSLWLIGHIGRVLMIVEPCQLCINQHQKTSSLICDLMICNLEDDARNALTILSLQLSYCKLEFSSCGFFKIKRSLLTSIAGAVTTYLVILFQFSNT